MASNIDVLTMWIILIEAGFCALLISRINWKAEWHEIKRKSLERELKKIEELERDL